MGDTIKREGDPAVHTTLTNLVGGGTKYDKGKPRMDLIDPYCIEQLAGVLTDGANKYAAHNWREGMSWSRIFSAMLRHAYKWWAGQEIDPESGYSHMAHVMCNAQFLLWYSKHRRDFDDRYETD